MIDSVIKLFDDYGWAVLIIGAAGLFLIRYISYKISVWNARDDDQDNKKRTSDLEEIQNHQLFSNLKFKLYNEIPLIQISPDKPVRQRMFRKLLEIKLLAIQNLINTVVEDDKLRNNKTSSQWAIFVISEIHKSDKWMVEHALQDGIPSIVVNKFMMWQVKTVEILINYVNDLAVSTIYSSNAARVNTLLYLLSLQLVTVVADAEKTFSDLNGEITGLSFNGDTLE